MFPESTQFLLIFYLIESIWTLKNISNMQLEDILTKINFTRDEWNHLLSLCKIRHCSFTYRLFWNVVDKNAKRFKWRKKITAKSKMMMNFVSRCSERTPDALPSTVSESWGKPKHESQFPLSSRTEQHHKTGRLVEDACSSSHSIECWRKIVFSRVEIWWSDGRENWETCKWTTTLFVHKKLTDLLLMTMMWVSTPWQNLSLKSRSFLHKVNDRVWKMLDQFPKDTTKNIDEHIMWYEECLCYDFHFASIWVNWVFGCISEIDIRMIGRDLGWIQLTGKIFRGNNYLWLKMNLWLKMKKSSVSCTQTIRFFKKKKKIVLCFGKMNGNPQLNIAWEDRLTWFKSSQNTELWTKLMVSQWNSIGFFSRFSTLQLVCEVQELLSRLGVEQENFTGRIFIISMFNNISWGSQDNEKIRIKCLARSFIQKFFFKTMTIPWTWIKKKGVLLTNTIHKGIWDRVAGQMTLTFAESKLPILRSKSPSRGVLKSKDWETL